jgi:hypothetical protein
VGEVDRRATAQVAYFRGDVRRRRVAMNR